MVHGHRSLAAAITAGCDYVSTGLVQSLGKALHRRGIGLFCSLQGATNRSNRHVDAKCGLSRDCLHPAEAQFADAHSGRRGLADRSARRLPCSPIPRATSRKHAAKYGLVYRSHLFGETSLVLLGPEANELVLFDQAKLFSSTLGWGRILGLLFPRGLMLLDFDEHRLHRRALSVAFKSGPMKSYLAELDTGIAARVKQWKAQPGAMLFYPAMKQLTLDLAATSFLGAGIGPEVDEITRAFVDMVAASVAVIRKPLPGTKMARGVQGRKRIVAYFSEQIPIRRAKGGEDLFSQLCHATHEDGALLSTQDIVDHMSFLMMAAHDTLTSSLTSFIGALAAHPEWQQKLREEVMALGVAAG